MGFGDGGIHFLRYLALLCFVYPIFGALVFIIDGIEECRRVVVYYVIERVVVLTGHSKS